jgi:hypothetical protein
MRYLPLLAAASVVAGMQALAEPTFDRDDTDGDGRVSKDEYYGLVDDLGIYSDWDTSSDGAIDRHEYDALGIKDRFDAWDTNDNLRLEQDEFIGGVFANYDLDADGNWDAGEWRAARTDGWLGNSDGRDDSAPGSQAD